MADELVWREPPPPTDYREARRRSKRSSTKAMDAVADMVRQQPGRWLLIGQRSSSGGGEQYKKRGLEVTTRLRADGQFDVYIRAPH